MGKGQESYLQAPQSCIWALILCLHQDATAWQYHVDESIDKYLDQSISNCIECKGSAIRNTSQGVYLFAQSIV